MATVTLTAVTVKVAAGPTKPLAWMGLYQIGAPDTQWTSWLRLSGTKTPPSKPSGTGTLTFAIPGRGPWELRLFGDTGYSQPLDIYPLRAPLSGPSNEGV